MENIQMDLAVYESPVPRGAESLTVEWSPVDHSSGGSLPSQTHATTVALERHRQGVACAEPDLMC